MTPLANRVMVWVDDVERQRVKGTVKVRSAIERRSTASVTIYDATGALSFSRGQKVDIGRATIPPFFYTLFSGVIGPKPVQRRIPGSAIIFHELRCVDWHYLADKRLAVASWQSVLYQNYTVNDDAEIPIFGVNFMTQTFTPATTHELSKVRLLLWKIGSPGTMTVEIQGVDGASKPDGVAIATGTIEGSSITSAGPGEWYDINMGTPVEVTAATQYAIVCSHPVGTFLNSVAWRADVTAPAYAGGQAGASNDSGGTWTMDAGIDFMFEEWAFPTTGQMVTDLADDYLIPEGVGVGRIQGGPSIEEALVNYQPVSRALDALATRSGFIWFIDYFKQLYFQLRTATIAPFAVVAQDVLKPSSSLVTDSSLYRNRQYIRAGKDVTETLEETFTGDGVREAFTVGYGINQTPTVTVNAVGQTVGIKGIDTASDCYWAKGDPVVVFDAGSIPGAVAVVITYIGEYDIMVVVEDSPEIAARAVVEDNTGINEAIADEPYLNSSNASIAAAEVLLEKYGVPAEQFNYDIREWGLEPGQIVTQTYAEYGLAADDLLVQSVDVVEIGGTGELAYRVKAITGPVLGDWTAFFGALAAVKDDIVGRLNVGTDQILIVVITETASWEQSESVSYTIYACPVVAVNLWPGVGIFPC